MKTLVIVIFLLGAAGFSSEAKIKPRIVDAYLGATKVRVELAITPAEQQLGLMNRASLGKNEGMLFVFPSERVLHFWMKNTVIPLSIGFFNSKKELIKVTEMKPASDMEINPPSILK
jgi:uncharacterized membrane protein (UPF0127 family)